MNEIARDIIKAIRERLNEIIADLDKMEDALNNAPPGAVEEVELPKEALDALPWKLYKSGKGEWIFSNLENPTATNLRETLTKNNGKLKLHDATYRFSGQDNKFISRYK